VAGHSPWLVAKSYQQECLHCRELFDPSARNRWHQRFCKKPECSAASKSDSHRRWLSKPANRDHFRGSANVERVRQWREAHPDYWKRAKTADRTLQDLVPAQPAEPQPVPPKTSVAPLQDLVAMQGPLLVGLISHLFDSPLQDHVEQTTLILIAKGQTILDLRSGVKTKTNHHEDQKTSPLSGTAPPGPRAVQLDRSTPGP
jgi:hypothetical protein